ncbi:DUF2087 domain-containing protein [Tritonibacter scottomollicae]|uniref:DUF2087 domain-containing protein n=1 Tax=Tritonibacter scottomollicae TaxID=483013 RepID=UPI003AA9C474
MPKTPLPLRADDLTSFVRALSDQLGDASPSHLVLMNMAARAAGYQNVQHMRSAHAAVQRLGRVSEETPADARTVERALHQFDTLARLKRWPSKRSIQTLALWALWATLPSGRFMNEPEINELFNEEHLFGDPATLRRTMISCELLSRRNDGSDYRRIEKEPPADAKALIRALGPSRQTRAQDVMEQTNA